MSKINYLFKYLLVILLITGCSESINDSKISDKIPDTHLFLYTDQELRQQPSKIKIHWWGDDPDGIVLGYFIKWEGLDDVWSFTSKNDSNFALPIGTADTVYTFYAASVDNNGNGIYDNSIIKNGIDFGAEPFFDTNNNGIWDNDEEFIDIGNIDDTPAFREFPIKNSAPEIEWNKTSVLPLESYPVVSVGWNTSDLDGNETIVKINLALNDTTKFISLNSSVQFVTLKLNELNSSEAAFRILINGIENNLDDELLHNLKINDYNRLYIQAEDISGSKSKFIALPDTGRNWFVKMPVGNFLVIDDFTDGSGAQNFYSDALINFKHENIIDILDVQNMSLPYESITFLQTLKLFKYIYWYSDATPRIDLLSNITQNYLNSGGKIALSMNFSDSTDTFPLDVATLQSFIPIDGFGENKPLNFLFPGASLLKTYQEDDYPPLRTSSTIGFLRTFVPSEVSSRRIYDISSNQINGNIAFMDNNKTIFFIGIPLHQADGNPGNVRILLEKIFFEEFGLSL